MGLRVDHDIDTTYENTQELYIKVENVHLNRLKKSVDVGIAIWVSKDYSDKFTYSPLPYGLVGNNIVLFSDDEPLGKEIEIPVFYSFTYSKEPKNLLSWIYKELKKSLGEYFSNIYDE